MPIGAPTYTRKVLPDSHRSAVLTACSMLIDQFFDDVAALLDGGNFSDTSMASSLPAKYLPRYDTLFAKQFLACIMTVSWKLFAPGEHKLACLAEELALSTILGEATGVLEMRGKKADFGYLEEIAFEDTDFESLFDLAEDGVEDTVVGEQLGMECLKFDEWFEPFNESEVYQVHPYALEGPKRQKEKATRRKTPTKKTVAKKKQAKDAPRRKGVTFKEGPRVAFHKIWEEQLAAAEGLKEKHGPEKALGYLIGEKLLKFIDASDTHPEFAAELPSFVTAIKEHFQPYEIREYLENVKRVGALGHIIEDDQEYDELRVADSRDNPVAAAEDAILLERAKELLLGSEEA